MIVCCRRCGNVMSPEEDGDHMVYRCPNCDSITPSWAVPQLAVQVVPNEDDYRYGDPVPPNERR